MPELTFRVTGVEAARFAVVPHLMFKLEIADRSAGWPVPIQAIVLRCQVRIDPAQRRYAGPEQDKLAELFGSRERWGQTVRGMLWAHADAVVPSFTASTTAELPIPCTFDFNVAATKYFDALENGEVPLCFLFSGTIFYEAGHGLQAAQIPWDREALYRLPVQSWKEMMAHYYPGSAWLNLPKDLFDRLQDYKRRHGLPTWEHTFDKLLAQEQGSVTS